MAKWFDKEMEALDAELACGRLTEREYNMMARELRFEYAEARRKHIEKMLKEYDEVH